MPLAIPGGEPPHRLEKLERQRQRIRQRRTTAGAVLRYELDLEPAWPLQADGEAVSAASAVTHDILRPRAPGAWQRLARLIGTSQDHSQPKSGRRNLRLYRTGDMASRFQSYLLPHHCLLPC
jgi:hypothetical protein